jgi:metal transporter CNNM
MLIPILRASLRPLFAPKSQYASAQSVTFEEPVGSPEFWWKLVISMFLVLGGGVFAGYVLHVLHATGTLLLKLQLTRLMNPG